MHKRFHFDMFLGSVLGLITVPSILVLIILLAVRMNLSDLGILLFAGAYEIICMISYWLKQRAIARIRNGILEDFLDFAKTYKKEKIIKESPKSE